MFKGACPEIFGNFVKTGRHMHGHFSNQYIMKNFANLSLFTASTTKKFTHECHFTHATPGMQLRGSTSGTTSNVWKKKSLGIEAADRNKHLKFFQVDSMWKQKRQKKKKHENTDDGG